MRRFVDIAKTGPFKALPPKSKVGFARTGDKSTIYIYIVAYYNDDQAQFWAIIGAGPQLWFDIVILMHDPDSRFPTTLMVDNDQ